MKKRGMYYRADSEEAVDSFCDECAAEVFRNYSVWEDLGDDDECECGICGAKLTN